MKQIVTYCLDRKRKMFSQRVSVCVLYRYGQAKKRKIEHLFKEVEGNLYTIFLVFHHVATHSAVLVVKLGLTAVYMTQYARIHTRDLLWSFIMFCALSCKCLPNRNRSLISCLPVRRRPMPFDMNILQCLLSDFLYFFAVLKTCVGPQHAGFFFIFNKMCAFVT